MREPLTIVTWVWRGERHYTLDHAVALAATIRRHATVPFNFVVIDDDLKPNQLLVCPAGVDAIGTPPAARALANLKTPERANFPSSYRRLWLFSEEAAQMFPGRLLLTDVDAVATGDWAPLVARPEPFVGWRPRQVWGRTGEDRLAGGMWLLRTGAHPEVYDEFVANPAGAIERARRKGFRGSDQAWLSFCLAGTVPTWAPGTGVYSVRDFLARDARGRRVRETASAPVEKTLPADARVVHFNGALKPWHAGAAVKYPWLREHWPT